MSLLKEHLIRQQRKNNGAKMKIYDDDNYINIKFTIEEMLVLATVINAFNSSFNLLSEKAKEHHGELREFTENFDIEYHKFLTTRYDVGR